MIQPLKCSMKKCTKNALLLVHGKFICGECYFSIMKKQQDNFWSENKNGSN